MKSNKHRKSIHKSYMNKSIGRKSNKKGLNRRSKSLIRRSKSLNRRSNKKGLNRRSKSLNHRSKSLNRRSKSLNRRSNKKGLNRRSKSLNSKSLKNRSKSRNRKSPYKRHNRKSINRKSINRKSINRKSIKRRSIGRSKYKNISKPFFSFTENDVIMYNQQLQTILETAGNTELGRESIWKINLLIQPELAGLEAIPTLKNQLINYEIKLGKSKVNQIIDLLLQIHKDLGQPLKELAQAWKMTEDKTKGMNKIQSNIYRIKEMSGPLSKNGPIILQKLPNILIKANKLISPN
jgi:hypothetical protein